MPFLPDVTNHEDENNRIFRVVAVILAPVLVLLMVFAQQFSISLHEMRATTAPRELVENETASEPGISPHTLHSKAILKQLYFIENLLEDEDRPRPHAKRGRRGADPPPEGQPVAIIDAETMQEILEDLDSVAVTRTERLRTAIAAGDVAGRAAALARLDTLQKELDPAGDLAADAQWLRRFYTDGESGITPEAREAIKDRHGWFGRLAFTLGKPASDTDRFRLLSGFDSVVVVLGTYVVVLILASLVGVGLFILALVMLNNGSLTGEFDAPAVGGTVYLEAFCVFLVGFTLMTFLRIPFRTAGVTGATVGIGLTEMMLWSLIGAVFWPLLRGVSWDALKIDLGLHTGAGALKEVWIGCLAFMAERPLLFLVGLVINFFKRLALGEEPPEIQGTKSFPLFQNPIGNAWWLVWLGALSSVVWAPVVEEFFFRGCLYRALHAKLRWPLAVVLSAAAFGIVHPYSAEGMIEVFVGGITFGLLREWRGSLIACITAHCLHNSSIELMNLAYLSILDS